MYGTLMLSYKVYMEVWKPIPSCPGYYASASGTVKGPRGILRGWLGKNGYYAFRPGRHRTNVYVHRAIAEAWLKITGPYVNHINHIKTDNRICNLEWCTARHNTACSNALYGHNHAKLTEDAKKAIVLEYKNGGISQANLGKKYGVTQKTIYNVLRSAQ